MYSTYIAVNGARCLIPKREQCCQLGKQGRCLLMWCCEWTWARVLYLLRHQLHIALPISSHPTPKHQPHLLGLYCAISCVCIVFVVFHSIFHNKLGGMRPKRALYYLAYYVKHNLISCIILIHFPFSR